MCIALFFTCTVARVNLLSKCLGAWRLSEAGSLNPTVKPWCARDPLEGVKGDRPQLPTGGVGKVCLSHALNYTCNQSNMWNNLPDYLNDKPLTNSLHPWSQLKARQVKTSRNARRAVLNASYRQWLWQSCEWLEEIRPSCQRSVLCPVNSVLYNVYSALYQSQLTIFNYE